MQTFLIWLMWIIIGIGIIYCLCGFTENFNFIGNWPSLTKGIFIITSLGWISLVTYFAVNDTN